MNKIATLTAALTAGTFACGTALAVPITDPGFNVNPNPSIAGVSNDEVDAWQNNGPNILNTATAGNANVTWYRSDPAAGATLVGPSGSPENVAAYNTLPPNANSTRGFMQVISNTSAFTGAHTLAFNYLLNDVNNDSPLIFRAEVFGINTAAWTGEFDLAVGNGGGDVSADDTYDPAQVTSLLNTTAFTETNDATVTGSTWQNASFAVDLGAGYEQIGIRFTATDGGATDDQIAIDNVSLVSAAVPEPSTAALLGLAGLAALRRRRAL